MTAAFIVLLEDVQELQNCRPDPLPASLPITAASAEYVQHIPEKSDLINQTSMSADRLGRPYIVTYWRAHGENVPQYRLIYHDGRSWKTSQITHRTLAFTLAGTGTRRIPLSRPQVVNYGSQVIVIFRDEERGSRVSAAVSRNLSSNSWDLTETPVGMWEPTYDRTPGQRSMSCISSSKSWARRRRIA
jgi:BNR repeat-containing family member